MAGITDANILELMKERGLEKYLLDRFVSRAIVEIQLSLEEAHLRIGAGREVEGIVDNPLLMMKYKGIEVPVIPGSTLKGALRSSIESLAASRGDLPLEMHLKNKVVKCTGDGLADTFSLMKSLSEEELPEDAIRCLTSPVVILFGAPWIAARLWAGNFFPVSFSATVLHRTAIDRFTMSVAEGKLHSLEVLEPGSTFRGKIMLHNIIPDPNGDLVQRYASEALNLLLNGLVLGGDKSRGGGLVSGKIVGGTITTIEDGQIKRYKILGFRDGKFVTKG